MAATDEGDARSARSVAVLQTQARPRSDTEGRANTANATVNAVLSLSRDHDEVGRLTHMPPSLSYIHRK